MSPFKIPDSGLRLMGSGGDGFEVPPQAFFLTLEDDLIENMIQSVQSGQELQLRLGSEPMLKYGSTAHVISPPSDTIPFDLYLTRPFESTKSAERLPNTSSLFERPPQTTTRTKPQLSREVENGTVSTEKKSSSSSSGLESDYEMLQNSLAAEEAARGRTQLMEQPLAGKRGPAKFKGRNFSPNPSSLPTSPALRGNASPAHNSVSASQQVMERAKRERVPLVHELAVQDQSIDYLREKWDGMEADFRPALEKIADPLPRSGLWAMRKNYFRELDVWTYNFDTPEQREKAIENAVRQFDRQRMSRGEPEWEKLNSPSDRGKGICLSKLQARIATKEPAPSAPKIKVQKPEDGSSEDRGDTTDSGKAARGATKMARTGSNPLPARTKPNAQAAQKKRLTTANKPKAATPKTSPAKGRGAKGGEKRILSQEIIVDSDASGDEDLPVPAPAAAPKVKAAVVAAKSKLKEAEVPKPRAAPRDVPRPLPAKRQREDDDSSSSSGTPLSKRLKGRPIAGPLKAAPAPVQQRAAPPAPVTKPKTTSPRKSSPLASSPPTNVSDMDDETPPPPPVKKRRPDMEKRGLVAQRKRFPDDIMSMTENFKTLYSKYEMLHRKIMALENPSQERVDKLLHMHAQLDKMKKRIQGAC